MSIKYIKGDLLKIVNSSKPILAHSCNCYGHWGGGILLQFKIKYPTAFKLYNKFCLTSSPEEIIGKCFVIEEADCEIACLFTSFSGDDTVEDIVEYTRLAIADFHRQRPAVQKLSIPKINSGIFGVPWEATEKVLQQSGLSYDVYVV